MNKPLKNTGKRLNTMTKQKIILDCDPGHDDAIAIMLAGSAPSLEILGITVEAGNQTLEKTGNNTLNLVQYLGLDVPVALGSGKPLKRSPMTCAEIHGETGLDGFPFSPLKIKYHQQNAVELMKSLLDKNEDVTLVPTGPLTNIAELLINYPEVKKHIKSIVLMGGSIGFGNVSPAAEFNILCDPEAADIVFNSGLDVYMLGLDVTRKALVLPDVMERMSKIDNKAGKLFIDLMKVFNENQLKIFGHSGAPLHDSATIISLLNPNVFTFKKMNVVIDVTGGPSYGRTNCDQYDYLHQPHNAYVAIDMNVNEYWNEVEKGLKRYSK